eukprot:CAMPEP_0180359590 /NCGR_PEP_ID=MMETSP0989-20121125/11354_1 /TAXON_ID=697907 /ORGANISM="non described non described, Strain CCMP2293" /LENGTH=131 /DNA_ID=CAMNT_0022350531 /DNA_START=190 /DNA_END=585 /DNA_ORIENTATION=-
MTQRSFGAGVGGTGGERRGAKHAGSEKQMSEASRVDMLTIRGPVNAGFVHTTFFRSSSILCRRCRSFSFSTAVPFASSNSSSCVILRSSCCGRLLVSSFRRCAASVAAALLCSDRKLVVLRKLRLGPCGGP